MSDNWIRKAPVFAIIGLFIGAGFVPSISSDNSSFGNTIYVDDDADPSWYDATHVRTVQEGIDNATAGDTVFVYNGLYNQQINIDKAIELIGENKTTTIIDSSSQTTIRNYFADNILIKGFTLLNHFSQQDNNYGVSLCFAKNSTVTETRIIGCYWGVQFLDNAKCSITNNEIQDGYIGIDVAKSSSCTISGNQLTDNKYGIELNDAGNTYISNNKFTNNGLYLLNRQSNATILNNTVNDKELLYLENEHDLILDNIPIGQLFLIGCKNITMKNIEISNASIGIEIIRSDNCYITNSKIHTNCYAGIMFLEQCRNNTISYNDISSNSYGIVINSVHYTFFKSNSIIGNTLRFNEKGIDLKGLKTTITDNIFEDNDEGIEVTGSQNVLTNNIIANSTTLGLYLFDALSCLISSNNFIDNEKHAVFRIFSIKGNRFRNNYWDSLTGLGPKVIFGIWYMFFFVDYWLNPLYLPIPWAQFDWNPAKEPYDIP